MNAWLPQASYPYSNFSSTSSLKFQGTKGLIGYTFIRQSSYLFYTPYIFL
ncbi:predicted protein [Plenodomus lingam JN3]|uniref:Predicted protein n=1 Tax=Leptosphaeria maculans (strain JN3 / isolate v23.1.3 / race Av1-4-5-6-7-8) TaxID=985895 RepID=E4ZRX5_LEPMJ|nr:predicted protein [Plenodomus lingam JN3]CBX90013.1 predicted protein [Plenodomus lingam JN3]